MSPDYIRLSAYSNIVAANGLAVKSAPCTQFGAIIPKAVKALPQNMQYLGKGCDGKPV
jgi:hypothetical protein